MRKFLKTSHVISRIFLYLSVIGVLLLYFFKPGVISLVQQFIPTADTGAWLALVTTLSIAAVMFAASELAYKSLTDNEFMITLSSSILETTYGRYDLSDRRFSKPAKGEFEFNQGLRDVTDEKERVMYELSWEKQNNKVLQKKAIGNMVVALIFFIAGLVFFFCPAVWYPVAGGLMSFETGTLMDYFSLVAIILTLFIIFEIGNNQGPIRRLNTILSIRTRSDELNEKPVLQAARPEYVYSNPAPVYETPKPAAPAAEYVSAAPVPAPVTVSESVKPEETWSPEPAWTGVPEEPGGSAFVNLTPDEENKAE
jgi:hypothetical protein